MRSKNGWVLLIMLLSGIVLGGFIGMLTENVSGLNWLNYGQGFGLETPIVLDLGLLVLTFGLTIHISIASIIGVVQKSCLRGIRCLESKRRNHGDNDERFVQRRASL